MAVLVNTAFAYPYWALPAVFSNKKWLMMGPVNGGMLQVFVHAAVLPKFAKDRWSPGVLTAILLHVPIGFAWYHEQAASDDPLTRKDIAKGVACSTPLLTEARQVDGYTVHLRFEDGIAGDVDFSYLLDFGGVFEPLHDPAYFARVSLAPEGNTIVWPNEADIAPETLYELACEQQVRDSSRIPA
jgi:Protein of unknown function (DUF2442)